MLTRRARPAPCRRTKASGPGKRTSAAGNWARDGRPLAVAAAEPDVDIGDQGRPARGVLLEDIEDVAAVQDGEMGVWVVASDSRATRAGPAGRAGLPG